MSWFYRTFLRPALFAQDSEEIHNRTLKGLAWASRHGAVCDLLSSLYGAPSLPLDLFGLRFPNPVGLAAGMDKQAAAVPVWEALGFGFVELGGVTCLAQPGNPAPRMFRAVAEEALINRMGFNNPGAEALAGTLSRWRAEGRWPKHPVGVNLGKSKATSLDRAAEDYATSFRLLRPHADFFVVNVSSPNTPNLRQLQDKEALNEILLAIQEINRAAGPPGSASPGKPVLVKVAPDLSFQALDEILDLIGPREIAGIVATNTTISRPQTSEPTLRRIYGETGGLSGRPLRSRSTEVIRHLYQQSQGSVPIIGVGGVFDSEDAWEKILAGASLLQIYTGLVYEGPAMLKEIVTGLIARLKSAGLNEIKSAIGRQVESRFRAGKA